MQSDDPLVHLSRAAGLGTYAILWLDMCLGVALTSWIKLPCLPRWRVGDLHQFTGMLSLALLTMHVGVLIGLQQHAFSLTEIFIPLVRQTNPLPPVLGISALYVLVLVAIISHVRRHVGLRVWRLVHSLSFVGFALALAHAIAAGPDESVWWIRALYAATMLVLLSLTLRRIHQTRVRQHLSYGSRQAREAGSL
jgi:sulfoxide reductase heme-binding subunit YedZ